MTEDLLQFVAAASLKGFVILALAWLVNAVWRSSSASARHLVWTVAMASALVLPVIIVAISRLDAPRIPIPFLDVSRFAGETQVANQAAGLDVPVPEVSDREATRRKSASTSPIKAAIPPVQSVDMDAALQSAPAARGSTELSKPFALDWRAALLYLWLAGVVLSLVPLITARLRIHALAKRPASGRWIDLIARTPAVSHLARRVRLIESDGATMPMTWGVFSPTLLLPPGAGRWSDWQCRNILLHELAHVERRDCLTQLIAQIVCALYWFNPLAWTIAHRMRVERELACDDRVIVAGSLPSDYARSLLDVARFLRAPSFTSHTAIAMARPSQLSGRLLAVLDNTRNRRTVTRRAFTGAFLAALAVVVPLASVMPETASAAPAAIIRAVQVPAIAVPRGKPVDAAQFAQAPKIPVAPIVVTTRQQRACWAEGDGNTTISISDDNKSGKRPSWTVRYTRDDCSLELRAEGKFAMRPDLSDLESLAPGGWFRVEERIGTSSRRVEIRRAGSGSLEHTYWVNGDRIDYNEDARAWLARTLLAVERRTAFAASTRVPQLYGRSGVRGVLSEIALMPSAYAKSRYYGSLLEVGVELDANVLNTVVRQVSTDLTSSDYYMSEVLGKFALQSAANESTWRAFAEAAGRMKSDHYKAQTLGKVLNHGPLSTETVAILLRSASGIGSDHYLTELLKSVAGKYALDSRTAPFYLDALRKVESDHYRGQLLQAINTGGEWDARTSSFVLASVGEIKSDYYKSQSLLSLIRARHVENWPAFFNAAETIGSDHYKRETLVAALRQEPLERAIVIGVLSTASRMKSDHEIAEVLKATARAYRIDERLRPAFERAVDSMESDHYRGTAMSALRRSMTQ